MKIDNELWLQIKNKCSTKQLEFEQIKELLCLDECEIKNTSYTFDSRELLALEIIFKNNDSFIFYVYPNHFINILLALTNKLDEEYINSIF